jgi:hypothetical protein
VTDHGSSGRVLSRLDRFDSADAYQQAVAGLSRMKTDIVIRKTFVAGSDVLTWYDPAHHRGRTGAGGRVEPRRARKDHDGAGGVRRPPVQPAC